MPASRIGPGKIVEIPTPVRCSSCRSASPSPRSPHFVAAGQVIGYPAKPRQRAELNRGTEPVLHADIAAQPSSVVAGERKERDQVMLGDLVRPATQPRELGVGQEPNRHTARYPRSTVLDKTVANGRPLREPNPDGENSGRRPVTAYHRCRVKQRRKRIDKRTPMKCLSEEREQPNQWVRGTSSAPGFAVAGLCVPAPGAVRRQSACSRRPGAVVPETKVLWHLRGGGG